MLFIFPVSFFNQDLFSPSLFYNYIFSFYSLLRKAMLAVSRLWAVCLPVFIRIENLATLAYPVDAYLLLCHSRVFHCLVNGGHPNLFLCRFVSGFIFLAFFRLFILLIAFILLIILFVFLFVVYLAIFFIFLLAFLFILFLTVFFIFLLVLCLTVFFIFLLIIFLLYLLV